MAYDFTITTDRLFLTPFAPEHADALYSMNSDPTVMRFLGGPESRDETKELIARVQTRWRTFGYSWWAVFLNHTETIVGSACLQNLDHKENAPLEIGWRLMTAYQGKGYATEAGQAAMDFGFKTVGVNYVCAATDPKNIASQRVMRRLGMSYVGIKNLADGPNAFYEKFDQA